MKTEEIYYMFLKPHYTNGQNIFIIDGPRRNDLVPVEDGGEIRILSCWKAFSDAAKQKKKIIIEYSFSEGKIIDKSELSRSQNEKLNIRFNQYFKCPGSGQINPEEELIAFARGLQGLVREGAEIDLDGEKFTFIFILKFSEHLLPDTEHTSVIQKIAIELVYNLSNSAALRKSNCLILLSVEPGQSINKIFRNNLQTARIPVSTEDERRLFVKAMRIRYPHVKTLLPDEDIVRKCSTMLNRSIEKIFFASSNFGTEITNDVLLKERIADIERQSRGMLTPVDTTTLKNKLVGRNIDVPKRFLGSIGKAFKNNKKAPMSLILAGEPSTAKSALIVYLAVITGILAFKINTIKSSLVGESERNMDDLFALIEDIAKEQPIIIAIDEIDSLNFDRNNTNLDSGVSDAIAGKFQSFTSNPNHAGRILIIGTSNRPERISEAMRTRFTIVPVFRPLADDMPEVLLSISQAIDPDFNCDLNKLLPSANRFSQAGCIVREIENALLIRQTSVDKIDLDMIEDISFAIIPKASVESYEYSQLMAIKFTSTMEFLPWWDPIKKVPDLTYPFPSYIQDVLENGYIEINKLNKKLEALKSFSNV